MHNTFTIKDGDKEVVLKVKKPSLKEANEAKKTYNEAFNRALQSKAPLRRLISNILTEQGLWNDSQQAEVDKVQEEISNLEFTLHKGGMSKTRGREIAIEIRQKRLKLNRLLSIHTEFDNNSAEGQAETEQFNHLVALCTVYNDNDKPYFASYEDYLEKSDSEAAEKAASELMYLVYGLDPNYKANLPENKFLKEFGFVDEKLRLIDKEGRLINIDGKLIDEEGNLVNEDGKTVDRFGHPINDKGEYDVETKPFTDE